MSEPMGQEPDDPVDVVHRGYDRIAERYVAARHRQTAPLLSDLTRRVRVGGEILDAGCGSGAPVGDELVARGFRVTGLDVSSEQLRMARVNNTRLRLVQGDLRQLPFGGGTFDAAVSIYTVFHLARAQHSAALAEFRRVLRDPGYLLVTMGDAAWEGVERFHGVDMYWSHFGRDRNRELIGNAGFRIIGEAIDEAAGERHAVFWAVTS